MSINKNDLTHDEEHVYSNSFTHLVDNYEITNFRINELNSSKKVWDDLLDPDVDPDAAIEKFMEINDVSFEDAVAIKRMLEAYSVISVAAKKAKEKDNFNILLVDLYYWFKYHCTELHDYMEATKDGEDDLNFDFAFPYDTSYNTELRTKKLLETYLVVKSITRKTELDDVDLIELYEWFRVGCTELRNYFYIEAELDDEKYAKECTLDSVNLRMLNQITATNKFCVGDHTFIRLDDELKCICCDATTKVYELTESELDFLTEAAKHQLVFNDSITKEDLPLVQVIRETENYSYKQEPSEADLISIHVRRSHSSDDRSFTFLESVFNDPEYLDDKKAEEYINDINSEIKRIQESESSNKDLMIETCKTAKYEVLILSGAHIPTLYEKASEDDKYALAKAYYNLIKDDIRVYNEFFGTPDEARAYRCYTANPAINSKVLEMIMKR